MLIGFIFSIKKVNMHISQNVEISLYVKRAKMMN